MLILRLLILSFGMLCVQPHAWAFRVDRTVYQYPYTDPYLATTTLSMAKGRDALTADDDVSRRSLRITVRTDRDDTHLLEGEGSLRFRFYQQPASAPLIFIIPGFGGSAASGSATYLAEVLVDEGFHVLILPSPFNWNFALAASRSGLPGITGDDSEDLYSAMRLTLEHVRSRYRAQVTQTGLMGLSSGALYAAYISKIDAERKAIGVHTYLLVNPPVDLFDTMKKVDQMSQIGRKWKTREKKRIEAYGIGVAAEVFEGASDRHLFGDAEYFMNWDKRFCLTREQMQYLIGMELQSAIGDVIYVHELVQQDGVLNTPISYWNRTDRFHEAYSHGLMDYVRLFLIPRLEKQTRHTKGGKGVPLAALSLKDIGETLAGNSNLFVMHNLDDFLVSREDLDFLEALMGDRVTLYPHGGHMGNIWYWQNREHILGIFRPLFDPRATRSRGSLVTAH